MNILTLNAVDAGGGAAIAARRLHAQLQAIDVNSQMLVLTKRSHADHITQIPGVRGRLIRGLSWRFDGLPLKVYRKQRFDSIWSLNWIPFPISSFIFNVPADLYHLHWIGSGFIPLHLLSKFSKPVVWTLHDSWAFTGGCHLPFDCKGYLYGCGNCPQLASHRINDISKWEVSMKQTVYKKLKLTIVTPSHWLAECARGSQLLQDKRVVTIPNGVDTAVYKPFNKQEARQVLGLPLDKKLILSGAINLTGDPNKGFRFLIAALQQLAAKDKEDVALVIIGADKPSAVLKLPLDAYFLGTLHDEIKINQVYSAVDTFVLPSLQETLPNMIMEALACGTPCVAFNIGGISDLIEHQRNGYLARPYDVDDLANGIDWVLSDDEQHQRLSARAREKVEAEFDIRHVALKYLALYNEVLENHLARTSE